MLRLKFKSLIRPLLKIVLSCMIAGLLAAAGWAAWRYHGPAPAVEIFRGITYGCDQLADTSQSSGLVHWTRADLNVPGVSIYTTPIDPEADARGFEYRLQYTSDFVADNHLAVAVNGALFTSESGFIRRPGDLALSCETLVSNHIVDHVDPNTYLLWWDDQNSGHLEQYKPPPHEALTQAKWAIGGQMGMLSPHWMTDETRVDQRTAIGIEPLKKLVWIACFDHASYHFVAQWLRDQGATCGISVDGGTSMAMVIGSEAKNVRPGTVTGNWRPVATHFGFKADPLP